MDRKLRYGLIAAAAVVVSAVALPFVAPVGAYRGSIERSAGTATGRTLKIAGGLRLTLFPLGVRAENVTLSNVPAGHAPVFASIADMRVAVRFLPLLGGRVEVSDIVLDQPLINLEVDASGHPNWIFPHGNAQRGGDPKNSSATKFSQVEIRGGRITYFNAQSRTSRIIEDLNASAGTPDPDKPLAIAGSFVSQGHRVGFDAKIAARENDTTAIDMSLTSDLLRASFDGAAGLGQTTGEMKLDSSSLHEAGAWLGVDLPSGMGSLSFSGKIASGGDTTTLNDMTLKLDGMTMHGHLSIGTKADKPRIGGTLVIDRLDLNPYLEKAAKHGGARVEHTEGWSTAPIALDILKHVDADLALDVGALDIKSLKIGRAQIRIALMDGLLDAHLDRIALYGGVGRAQLTVDASGPEPRLRNTLAFDNAAVQPLLADTIGVQNIEGTGTITLDVSSQGGSADAIMRGLSGHGAIAFHNGRIRGVDLGAVARTIEFVLGGGSVGQSAITDYSDMGGSFAIANGVLSNKDFRLTGPLLLMTGAGNVDIGNRAIDFRVEPKAVAKLAGRTLNIGIPFRISGPWSHVRYTPEISGIAKGVIQNLESGRAPFKGLFGSSQQSATLPADQSPPKKKHKSVGDALKNMLGIH
jgi:AsmA protein